MLSSLSLKRRAYVPYLLVIWYFKNPLFRWASLRKGTAEKFFDSALDAEGKIPEEVLEGLDKKIEKLRRSLKPVAIVGFAIFCVLLLSSLGIEFELDLSGVKIKNTDKMREILFVFLATLDLLLAANKIPVDVLDECLSYATKRSGKPEYIRYRYGNSFDLILEIFSAPSLEFWAAISGLFLIIMFLLSYALVAMIVWVGVYYYVGLEMYRHPAFGGISKELLIYGIAVLTFSVVVQTLPYIPFRCKRLRYSKLWETAETRDKRKQQLRAFGAKTWRVRQKFLRIALNRRHLLDGMSRVEILAALGNPLARKQIAASKRH